MITYPHIIQGSEEWANLRRLRPTASNADKIITAVKGDLSKSAGEYALKLVMQSLFAAEPDPVGWIGNVHTDNGSDREEEARKAYTALTGYPVQEMGFVTTDDGFVGCSPDGLVPFSNGAGYLTGVEIKCPMSHTHAQYLLDGKLPDAYKQQVHCAMYVTGLESWDFFSYFPTLRPLHIVVQRDEYTEKLAKAMDEFRLIYHETKKKIIPLVTK